MLWDLDPQGAVDLSCSASSRRSRAAAQARCGCAAPCTRLIKGTDHERLDLLPSDFSYRHLDLALDAFRKPTERLTRVLAPLRGEYDYIFLDCPPSISLVSESVFEPPTRCWCR